MSNLTLKGKLIINGIIETETGLHIGGTAETLKIGGSDNPVIRDKNGRVFIPGSSLKGKIRSLLEVKDGKSKVSIQFYKYENGKKKITRPKKNEKENYTFLLSELTDDKLKLKNDEKGYDISALPCDCGETDCHICMLFGPHKSENIKEPSRAIIRDAYLKLDDGKSYYEHLEIKPENVIDRVKGTAQHPRFIERVVKGSNFEYEIIFNIYKEENDKKLIKKFIEGMKLLEDDYLGGSGSRGYGKIKFKELKAIYKPKEYYEGDNSKIQEKPENNPLDKLDKLMGAIDEIKF